MSNYFIQLSFMPIQNRPCRERLKSLDFRFNFLCRDNRMINLKNTIHYCTKGIYNSLAHPSKIHIFQTKWNVIKKTDCMLFYYRYHPFQKYFLNGFSRRFTTVQIYIYLSYIKILIRLKKIKKKFCSKTRESCDH